LVSGAARLRATAGRGGRFSIGRNLVSNGRLHLSGPGRIRIGDDCNAWARAEANVLSTFSPDAVISIGDNVRLNGAGIQAASAVTIGNDCILGSCTIVDTDHHSVDVERRRPGAPVASSPVVVEDNVWIAGMATVLKGVRVGRDSVVGFGAIVSSDVPAGVVVAGNPARVVRNLYEERAVGETVGPTENQGSTETEDPGATKESDTRT
jgi:acetyltransferase-like isoleucine patch superfamily enzyme